MEYSLEELQERFDSLPEPVQQAMLSTQTVQVMSEIEDKFKLHIDQIGTLARETGLLMLGFTKPADFIHGIAAKMRIPLVQAQGIAAELNSKVFAPIRDYLKEVHNLPRHAHPEGKKETLPIENNIFEQKMGSLFVSNTDIQKKSASGIQAPDPYRESIE